MLARKVGSPRFPWQGRVLRVALLDQIPSLAFHQVMLNSVFLDCKKRVCLLAQSTRIDPLQAVYSYVKVWLQTIGRIQQG